MYNLLISLPAQGGVARSC